MFKTHTISKKCGHCEKSQEFEVFADYETHNANLFCDDLLECHARHLELNK